MDVLVVGHQQHPLQQQHQQQQQELPAETMQHGQHAADSSYTNLSNCIMLTPTAQHKLCLETSFTNLQHQLEQRAVQSGCGVGGGGGGSKASSIAGSIFGRSQLSSTTTPYDISSVLDDSITTVAMRGKSPCSMLSESTTVILNASANEPEDAPRLKAVVFDMTLTPPPAQRALPKHATTTTSTTTKTSPSRVTLARQHSEKKPRSLPITQALRRASVSGQGVDLLHDDWYGLAPLASPETLSEISSVSSRSSVPISLANSIERYLQHMGVAAAASGVPKVPLEDIFESQLHTPKVMRRAPKFTENLAGCAEDSRNLDQYKRLGRVFVTFPRIFPGPDASIAGHLGGKQHKRSLDSNSSDDDSFESAHSLHRLQLPATVGCSASSKSADQLDETTRNTTPPVKKLTFSDSNILADEHCLRLCPHCPCRRDGRDDCCTRTDLEHEHQSTMEASTTTTAAVGSTDTNCSFYSASSSLEQFATPGHRQAQVQVKLNGGHALDEILIRPGVLESHFPVYSGGHNAGNGNGNGSEPAETPAIVAPASPSPLSNGNGNGGKRPDVVGGRVRKRLSSEEFVFARTEDLPMLVQIGDRSGHSSPSGRKQRRGCCVYPIGIGVGIDVVPDATVAAASPTSISKFSRTRVAAAATAKAAAAATAATAAAATAGGINNESNV